MKIIFYIIVIIALILLIFLVVSDSEINLIAFSINNIQKKNMKLLYLKS